MGTIPTVKIQAESGYVVINKSDFDRRTQKLYKEPEIKEPEVEPEVVVEPEKEPAIKSKKYKEAK